VQRLSLEPFKKLKKSLSTVSMPSNALAPSITVSPTENEGVDPGNESSTDSKGDGSRSEPEVELTPEEEQSTLSSYNLLIISASEALQEHWRSPIYIFFNRTSFSSTTMAGLLTFSLALLPNANFMLVAFVATKILRTRLLLQTSNTMPYAVLEKMPSNAAMAGKNTLTVIMESWPYSLIKASNQ